MLYLITGIENPTPYDYPLSSALGDKGQEEIIRAISERKLRWIWVDQQLHDTPELVPDRLVSYIRENMKPARQTGPLLLYWIDINKPPINQVQKLPSAPEIQPAAGDGETDA